jgi:hypothetical protein
VANTCFAHNHMTMRQHSLWTRLRELQSKFGYVFFDGEKIAAGFQDTARSTVYKQMTWLVKNGWVELVEPQGHKKDGTFSARKIVALAHKDWMSKYPNKCRNNQDTVPQVDNGKTDDRSTGETDRSTCETNRSTGETDRYSPVDKDLVLKTDVSIKQTPLGADASTAAPTFFLKEESQHIDMHESAPESCAASGVVHSTERIELTQRQALEQELARARKSRDNWERNGDPAIQVYLEKSRERVTDLEEQLLAMESNSSANTGSQADYVQCQ